MVDVLHISTPNTETSAVKIYTINGVLAIKAMNNTVDVSKLVSGIYIVEVNGQKIKVVKQ